MEPAHRKLKVISSQFRQLLLRNNPVTLKWNIKNWERRLQGIGRQDGAGWKVRVLEPKTKRKTRLGTGRRPLN
jgi:hypothetical protein